MAKATANCTCTVCGKKFEQVKILRNCKEAESWQKWAEDNIDMCPECGATPAEPKRERQSTHCAQSMMLRR